jgi:hypothetical protein
MFKAFSFAHFAIITRLCLFHAILVCDAVSDGSRVLSKRLGAVIRSQLQLRDRHLPASGATCRTRA